MHAYRWKYVHTEPIDVANGPGIDKTHQNWSTQTWGWKGKWWTNNFPSFLWLSLGLRDGYGFQETELKTQFLVENLELKNMTSVFYNNNKLLKY